GLGVGAGLARGSAFGETAVAALLIALAIIDRSWETFTLALLGPVATGATFAVMLAEPAQERPFRARLAAFLGAAVVWLAVCVGEVREVHYPNASSLDGICAALALLAVNRGLAAVTVTSWSRRAIYAALVGAVLVGASVFIHAPRPALAGRSLSSPIVAMTFNIHRGVGADHCLDLERIARV